MTWTTPPLSNVTSCDGLFDDQNTSEGLATYSLGDVGNSATARGESHGRASSLGLDTLST